MADKVIRFVIDPEAKRFVREFTQASQVMGKLRRETDKTKTSQTQATRTTEKLSAAERKLGRDAQRATAAQRQQTQATERGTRAFGRQRQTIAGVDSQLKNYFKGLLTIGVVVGLVHKLGAAFRQVGVDIRTDVAATSEFRKELQTLLALRSGTTPELKADISDEAKQFAVRAELDLAGVPEFLTNARSRLASLPDEVKPDILGAIADVSIAGGGGVQEITDALAGLLNVFPELAPQARQALLMMEGFANQSSVVLGDLSSTIPQVTAAMKTAGVDPRAGLAAFASITPLAGGPEIAGVQFQRAMQALADGENEIIKELDFAGKGLFGKLRTVAAAAPQAPDGSELAIDLKRLTGLTTDEFEREFKERNAAGDARIQFFAKAGGDIRAAKGMINLISQMQSGDIDRILEGVQARVDAKTIERAAVQRRATPEGQLRRLQIEKQITQVESGAAVLPQELFRQAREVRREKEIQLARERGDGPIEIMAIKAKQSLEQDTILGQRFAELVRDLESITGRPITTEFKFTPEADLVIDARLKDTGQLISPNFGAEGVRGLFNPEGIKIGRVPFGGAFTGGKPIVAGGFLPGESIPIERTPEGVRPAVPIDRDARFVDSERNILTPAAEAAELPDVRSAPGAAAREEKRRKAVAGGPRVAFAAGGIVSQADAPALRGAIVDHHVVGPAGVDNVPAMIDGETIAQLTAGEAVIPKSVVDAHKPVVRALINHDVSGVIDAAMAASGPAAGHKQTTTPAAAAQSQTAFASGGIVGDRATADIDFAAVVDLLRASETIGRNAGAGESSENVGALRSTVTATGGVRVPLPGFGGGLPPHGRPSFIPAATLSERRYRAGGPPMHIEYNRHHPDAPGRIRPAAGARGGGPAGPRIGSPPLLRVSRETRPGATPSKPGFLIPPEALAAADAAIQQTAATGRALEGAAGSDQAGDGDMMQTLHSIHDAVVRLERTLDNGGGLGQTNVNHQSTYVGTQNIQGTTGYPGSAGRRQPEFES